MFEFTLLLLTTVVVVLTISNIIKWYIVSHGDYGSEDLEPGQHYQVHDRTYTVPNIPVHGKKQHIPVLKPEFLARQRQLLQDVMEFLQNMRVEYWLAGGTLLGFMRHKTFIPWDDDIDLHVMWKHREFLFSDECKEACEATGLQRLILRGCSTDYATKEGAAVRFRHVNSALPVCDIFFVKTLDTPDKDKYVAQWMKKQKKKQKNKKKKNNNKTDGGEPDEWLNVEKQTNKEEEEEKEAAVAIDGNVPAVTDDMVGKVDSWWKKGTRTNFSKVEVWRKDQLFPIKTVTIDDLDVPVPQNTDYHLTQQYGQNVLTSMKPRNKWFSHAYPYRVLGFAFRK